VAKELKRLVVEELTNRYQNVDRCVLVNFTGVSAQLADEIRASLRDANITLHVVKNSLMARALLHSPQRRLEGVTGFLEGTTAIATGADDVVGLVRGMVEVAQRWGNFRIAGGFGEGQPLAADDIRRYAAIPPREHLLAQFLGAVVSPLRTFVRALDGFTTNFVRVLDAVARKRTDGPEEAAQPGELSPSPKEGAAGADKRSEGPSATNVHNGGVQE